MYWYLRRTFSQRQDQNLRKRKRERGKNVRICSPSLALKKKYGALERYCCWSSQVPICVPAPCDPSLWPLTPDPYHSCAKLRPAELSIICRRHGGVTVPLTWLVVTSNKPHLPVPRRQIKDWRCCIFDAPLLTWSQHQNVEWLSEMQLILWLPKALQATICLVQTPEL